MTYRKLVLTDVNVKSRPGIAGAAEGTGSGAGPATWSNYAGPMCDTWIRTFGSEP